MLARLRGDAGISPPHRGALWKRWLAPGLVLRIIVAVHFLQELLTRLAVRHVLLLN